MDAKEALEILSEYYPDDTFFKLCEAYDCAISALKKEISEEQLNYFRP